VDAVAEKNNEKVLVSLKWQQTSGAAEQKVPFEVMCLADAVRAAHASRAISCSVATAGRCETTTRQARSLSTSFTRVSFRS
jgi:hypothetical protein